MPIERETISSQVNDLHSHVHRRLLYHYNGNLRGNAAWINFKNNKNSTLRTNLTKSNSRKDPTLIIEVYIQCISEKNAYNTYNEK